MTGPRRFRFGVQLGSRLAGEAWVAQVLRAEEVGFSTVLLPDHLDANPAPWSALATAAAHTQRLRVGTYVINNDLRHPSVVAHEAATLDRLSDGRLELGVGAGWNHTEYQETGLPFDPPSVRIARLQESVSIIKALLGGETVSFHGEHYTVRDHRLDKPTVQRPRPPILIGGNGDRLLTLAARQADIVGLLGFTVRDGRLDFNAFTPAALRPRIDLVRRQAGARVDDIELSALVWYLRAGRTPRSAAQAVAYDSSLSLEDVLNSPFTLFGTTADMVAKLRDCRDAFGITYWVVGPDDIEPMKGVIEALAGS